MQINWEIPFGTILHLIGVLVAGAMAYSRLQARMDSHSEKLEQLHKDFTELRTDIIRRLEDRVRALEIQIGVGKHH